MAKVMGFAWERHRFKDLLDLGRRARDGYCANTTVTKQEGENLLTLLAEAVQYQEAHEHSQALRAEAERRLAAVERLHAPVERRFVDDDGAQHAPIQVCSTCAVSLGGIPWPCPTVMAARTDPIGSSSDPSDCTTQGQL